MPTAPASPGYGAASLNQGAGATQSGDSWWDTNSAGVGKLASGAAPLLLSLFGSNDQKDKAGQTADQLKSMSDLLGKQGQSISKDGLAALAPVFKYLMNVTSGDPGSLEAATEPQRARVIDQYDTARRGAQFLPRGGGQAGAMLDINAREASDISGILASARTEGVNSLGSLGKGLLDTGLSETRDATSALNQALAAYTHLGENKDKQDEGFGAALGGFLSDALPIALAFL